MDEDDQECVAIDDDEFITIDEAANEDSEEDADDFGLTISNIESVTNPETENREDGTSVIDSRNDSGVSFSRSSSGDSFHESRSRWSSDENNRRPRSSHHMQERDYHRDREYRRDREYQHERRREYQREKEYQNYREKEYEREREYLRYGYEGRKRPRSGSNSREYYEPLSKFPRSSSRTSDYSDHSVEGGNSRSSQSFEEMARSFLAGTLREDDHDQHPAFGRHPSGTRLSPTPPSAPMFGAPPPQHSSQSEFDILRQSAVPFNIPPPPIVTPVHPIITEIQKTQTEMVSRVIEVLSVVDENPTRLLRAQYLNQPQQILNEVYSTICPNYSSLFAPQVTFPFIEKGEAQLEFSTEAMAAVFRKVLKKHNYESSFHSFPTYRRTEPDHRKTTVIRKSVEKAGIPKRTIHETYLLCSIFMETISASSVEHGTVSAPIKICLNTGYECFTKTVIPLQFTKQFPDLGEKIKLREEGTSLMMSNQYLMDIVSCSPSVFIDEMFLILARHLKQHNSENKYDKIIFLFRYWKQAKVFTDWIKLAGYQNQFESFVQKVGFVPAIFEHGHWKTFKETTGWQIINPKDHYKLGVQEEGLVFHSVLLSSLEYRKDNSNLNFNINDIISDSHTISTSKAFVDGLPVHGRGSSGSGKVCVLSLEYIDFDGEYELSQIGAVLYSHNSAKKEKKVYFNTVLPRSAVNDPMMMGHLGLSRNEVSGKVEYHNLAKMASYEVVSEIQALMDLFTFLKSKGCKDSILLTHSNSTTLPVLLHLISRHGLENIFYKMFSAFCDIQTILEEIHPNNDFYTNGVLPFQELASELCPDIEFIRKPSASDSAVEILEFIFKVIGDSKAFADPQYGKLIRKCSRSISCLHFTDSFCMEMFPQSDQFIFPRESKLVEFKMTFADDEIDFSKLVFILHSQILTGSDKLLLINSTITRSSVSAIVQNISNNPFLLNPESSLGFLIQRPESFKIPKRLPSISHSGPVKHTSVEGLYSKTKNVQNEIIFAPKAGSNEGFYEGMTNLSSMIKSSIKEEHQIKPLKKFPLENTDRAMGSDGRRMYSFTQDIQKFDLVSISLRCLKQKGSSKNLIPIQILVKSMWLKKDPILINILPWDSSLYPKEDFLCSACGTTRGLHFPNSCPSLEPCTFCKGSEGPHSKAECPNLDFCFNCGKGHYWRACPMPILNSHQQELKRYGYEFRHLKDRTEITFVNKYQYQSNKKMDEKVFTRENAIKKLVSTLESDYDKFKGNYVVGYNIFMILAVIIDMAESLGLKKTVVKMMNSISGVIDVKWLFPNSMENKSLENLCYTLRLKHLEKKFLKPTEELRFVDRAVQEILKEELNLSLFKDVSLLCSNYAIKVVRFDLKVLSRKQIVAPRTLFSKLKSFDLKSKDQEAEDDVADVDEDDDEDDGIMKDYTMYKHKSNVHHINQLEINKKDKCEMILAIKTFEVGGKKYLHSLSLGSISGKVALNFPAIVPSPFYKSEDDHDICNICCGHRSPVLHSTRDCPTKDPCTIHPAEVKEHKRQACAWKKCWNCGEDHNWKNCRNTILTQTQQFLSTVGYKDRAMGSDGRRMYSFTQDIQNIEVKVDCVREEQVFESLFNVLEGSRIEGKKNVLIGYNIGEQLLDLMECCEEQPSFLRDGILADIYAVCDLQYLPRFRKSKASLKKILKDHLKRAALKDTESVVKSIYKLVTSFQLEREKGSVKFSKNLAKTLTYKQAIILDPGESLSEAIEQFNSVLAFVYLEHSNYSIEYFEIQAKSKDSRHGNRVLHMSKRFDKSTSDRDLREMFNIMIDHELMRGLKNPFMTLVTVCPETLDVLKINFERLMKKKLVQIFNNWICLGSEISFLQHFLTKLPPYGIKFDKDLVENISKEVIPDFTSNSKIKQMEKIYEFLQTTKMQRRNLGSSLLESDTQIVFFSVSFKDAKFRDEYGCPYIEEIQFKALGHPKRTCEKVDIFFELLKSFCVSTSGSVVKNIVFIAMDDSQLVGLMQVGFWNHGMFETLTAGATTLKEILSSQNTDLKDNLDEYLKSFGSLEKDTKLETMEKAFAEARCKNKVSYFHLHSPFVNKILLNSSLNIFSDKFVCVKLKRRNWNPGNNVSDGLILKTFWNVDPEKFDVKLNIISVRDSRDVVVPSQSSIIEKGKELKVIVVNKSQQPKAGVMGGEGSHVFGTFEFIPKAKEERIVSVCKGFEDLREDVYQRWPEMPKKKVVFNEMVSCFQNLGFKSYQEALKSVLDKSKNVQKINTNLHEFIVNSFPNCALVAELMFCSLYNQFVAAQKEKEKYPEYKSILGKKFPENWKMKSKIDGETLEFSFNFEKIAINEEEIEIIEVQEN